MAESKEEREIKQIWEMGNKEHQGGGWADDQRPEQELVLLRGVDPQQREVQRVWQPGLSMASTPSLHCNSTSEWLLQVSNVFMLIVLSSTLFCVNTMDEKLK
jgi:hypothetical protein